MSQQTTQICDNCLKPFPESKIATHFGYCRRNIKKCPKCGEMYDINFQEQHQEEFHKMSSCKYCKKQFKPNEMAKHEENCTSRTKYCEYCDLDVPLKDYLPHLRECEARTKQCDKCRKPIANKDYLIHTVSCKGYVQEIKPPISITNQYQDYQTYIKQQKKREEIKANEYKPVQQQPKRQGPKGNQTRPQHGLSSNIYGNNNGLRQAEIKKQAIITNKPSTNQTKPSNYADIKMNSNAVKYGDQRIPASNIYEKDIRNKVESNSNKNIEFNKNLGSVKDIGTGKLIQNKYVPSVKPVHQFKSNVNNYGISKQFPKNIVQPANNNGRSHQPPQMDVNSKNGPYNYSSKLPDTYKREVPSSKQIIHQRKEDKPKQVQSKHREYEFKRQDPRRQDQRKYQEPQRFMPKTYNVPVQEYSAYNDPRQYVPEQSTYQNGSGVNDHEMDEQFQKALMESLGNMGISSPQQVSYKTSKPSYKMDEIPAEFLETDMMNESFYGKQQAIWEEIERNKKRR